MNHKYSTYAFIGLMGILFMGFISGIFTSEDIDEVCSTDNMTLFRWEGEWQCGSLENVEINYTINNITNIIYADYWNRSVNLIFPNHPSDNLNLTGNLSVFSYVKAINSLGNYVSFNPSGTVTTHPRGAFTLGSVLGESITNVAFWIYPDTIAQKPSAMTVLTNSNTTTNNTKRTDLHQTTTLSSLFTSSGTGNSAGTDLSFYTYGNDNQLYLKNDGNVGIGTTNPTTPLYVQGTDSVVNFVVDKTSNRVMTFAAGQANSGVCYDDGGGLNFGTATAAQIRANTWTSLSSALYLSSSRYVGIAGATSPPFPLSVGDQSYTTGVAQASPPSRLGFDNLYDNTGNSTANKLMFYNIGGQRYGIGLSSYNNNYFAGPSGNHRFYTEHQDEGTMGTNVVTMSLSNTTIKTDLNVYGSVNITKDLWVQGQNMTIPDYVFDKYKNPEKIINVIDEYVYETKTEEICGEIFNEDINDTEIQCYDRTIITEKVIPTKISEYKIPTLDEVKQNVELTNSLPRIESADETGQINVVQRQNLLLEKIEEIYIYLFGMDDRITQLENENTEMKKSLCKLGEVQWC